MQEFKPIIMDHLQFIGEPKPITPEMQALFVKMREDMLELRKKWKVEFPKLRNLTHTAIAPMGPGGYPMSSSCIAGNLSQGVEPSYWDLYQPRIIYNGYTENNGEIECSQGDTSA